MILTSGDFDVDDGVMIGYAEALLRSVLPERDPLAEQAAALVARITDDPGLRRVDQLAAASGHDARGPCSGCSPTTSGSAPSG